MVYPHIMKPVALTLQWVFCNCSYLQQWIFIICVLKFSWWENSIVYPGWQLYTGVHINQHFRDQLHLMTGDRGSHWNAGELGATWGCSYKPLKIGFNTDCSLIMLQYICAPHYIKELSPSTCSRIVVKAAVTHRNLIANSWKGNGQCTIYKETVKMLSQFFFCRTFKYKQSSYTKHTT